jgi:exodeoxyribonuclease V beta subunit
MNGMLTGFMDLVFEHEGLYYVLDYKSNFLNNYSINELTQSILDHRYDVQYTLYLVALHRLLKFRLDYYEYDTHMGGAVYMYLRGVNTSSRGIFVDRPPKELILSIDNEFKGCK